MNKFVEPRPYAEPKIAARKIVELANTVEPVQDGRIHIEKINGPMLFELKATPAEYKAGLDLAIAKGWLGFTRAARSCVSPRSARICLPDQRMLDATALASKPPASFRKPVRHP